MTILKPVNSLKVRDPETLEFLNPEGEEKELNTYWRRRMADGDVEVIEEQEDQKGIIQKQKNKKEK